MIAPPFPLLPVSRGRCLPKPIASSLLLAAALGANASLLAQPAQLEAADVDWVAWQDLTPAQRAKIPDGCCGMYVEPAAPPAEGEPGTLFADSTQSQSDDTGVTRFTGNVKIRQGTNRLSAEKGTYNQNSQVVTLEDNVQIRQSGMLLLGQKATANRATETEQVEQASYLLHESGVRGTAKLIVYRDATQVITIENGVFTRCEPDDDAWELRGDHIVLDRSTGMGTARDMTLAVRNVPILYFPWISFPIGDQRASGFLAPVIGSTRRGGIELATPYYFNLAPNYDLTLTPRLQSERGLMLGMETRYLGHNFGQTVNLDYLPDDQRYDAATVNAPGTFSPPQRNRWSMDYKLTSALGDGWSANVNYRAISDRDFFRDFSKTGLTDTVQSYLYRSAGLYWGDRHWSFAAITENIQLIDPTVSAVHAPYHTLPRLKLDGHYWLPSGLQYGISSEYAVFDRDIERSQVTAADIASGALVTGKRLAITPEISLPLTTSYSFFTPTVKYKYASYSLTDQIAGFDSSPSRGIWSANIDTGLIFERDTTFGDHSYRQTLEPRLYYLYNQYADQHQIPLFDTSQLTFSFNQLFRDDRFSGKDRVGDANQLTAAVTSRLYDEEGQEQASLSLGRIQYFADRRVTLQGAPTLAELNRHSALTAEAGYRLAEHWRLASYLEWNTTTSKADVASAGLQYQSDANHLVNVGWRYREMPAPRFINGFDRRINQSDVSAVWPVAANWNVVGRWNYDYSNKRTLEGIAGIEYGNCCWRIRLIARNWIDNYALLAGREDKNTGVFVQFELKGLGSLLGGSVNNILNNGISGFRDRNNVVN